MAKRNEELEHYKRMYDVLKNQLEKIRESPGDLPVNGCGDSGCIVARPEGQHTNGGCRCNEHKLRMALTYWHRKADFLQETIKLMKDESVRSSSDLVEQAASVCENMIIGGRAWTEEQSIAAGALAAAAKNIRMLK